MIESIKPQGKLLHECGIEGERRSDDVYPAHINGCQLSADRWMLIFATRGWRNVDDDRSIIYQLRADSPDGRLICEGRLQRSIDDWDSDGDGSRCVLQHGHPGVFGLPKGTLIKGQRAENANLFMARWRRNSYGILDPETGIVERIRDGHLRQLHVEEVQFRLNEADDDIEVLTPITLSREKGYKEGPEFCRRGTFSWMNQNITQSVPYNEEGTEWVSIHHFDGGRVAAIKYRFDRTTNRYQWVDTGPLLQTEGWEHVESSIVRGRNGWIICTRAHVEGEFRGANGWVVTEDPFHSLSDPVFTRHRQNRTPFSLYNCPDGQIRMFTGDAKVSPYRNARNPLYSWRIDLDAFQISDRREVFDCIAEGFFGPESSPKSEMCKLLPHTGGRDQFLLWRIRVMNIAQAGYHGLPAVTEQMKGPHGIYYARVRYTEDLPGMWSLG